MKNIVKIKENFIGGNIEDKVLKFFIYFFSFLTLGVLAWILIFVLIKGLPNISLEFLTTAYKGKNHGILPMIISTLYVIILSVIISTPIGICSAIHLTEYSKPGKIVRLIRFATETLASIPSIIYGLFGFVFFVVALKLKFSLISGSLTLSIMVLPTIIRTTEEALKAVPNSYREGSLALGATKLWTIIRVVLPCAIPGILTGVILSIGRIVGESAVLIFTAGTVTQGMDVSLTDSCRTMSVHLYMLAKEGLSLEETFATAAVLILVVAFINYLAGRIAANIKKGTMGV
ncbi:MAG: phosphate ABC transporter permease PstA [Clostridia bacterium]|nr:phosphate ABC transporter permease PstA [Clostridia bacterium]